MFRDAAQILSWPNSAGGSFVLCMAGTKGRSETGKQCCRGLKEKGFYFVCLKFGLTVLVSPACETRILLSPPLAPGHRPSPREHKHSAWVSVVSVWVCSQQHLPETKLHLHTWVQHRAFKTLRLRLQLRDSSKELWIVQAKPFKTV